MGKSEAQVAINWLLQRPGVTSPIIGARTLEQLKENLGAIGWSLPSEHSASLDEVSSLPLPYPHDFIAWAQSER
jgi:aryl-alcohol dehydrogenase-like predicted oxidoreductase